MLNCHCCSVVGSVLSSLQLSSLHTSEEPQPHCSDAVLPACTSPSQIPLQRVFANQISRRCG